jgi:hypothetical protein
MIGNVSYISSSKLSLEALDLELKMIPTIISLLLQLFRRVIEGVMLDCES